MLSTPSGTFLSKASVFSLALQNFIPLFLLYSSLDFFPLTFTEEKEKKMDQECLGIKIRSNVT